MSTEELWRGWRARREADCFEALVRPHVRHVVDVARRSGCSAAEAEDVLQESLLLLARERSDEPVRVGLRAWLARRARFRARKVARAAGRRRRHERASFRERAAKPPPEVRDEVEHALGLLGETERQAVVLRYLHDLDYREIAYVLGASEGACRLRVHKGIGRLRRLLGGHAAALIAALGLPHAKAEAALIAKAAALPAALVTGGAIAMTTGTKMGIAAVIGGAVAAAGLLTTDTVFRGETARTPFENARTTRTRAAATPDSLGDLEPTADELRFAREALVKERERREAARIRPEDSGLDVLRRVLEHGADPSDLLRDFDRFGSHVREAAGPAVRVEATGEVTTVDLTEVAGDAAVLEFGPGTFRLRRGRFHDRRTDLEELVIRGAGMEKTTLLPESELLMISGRLEHLRVRDLTCDGGERGHELLDIRGDVAVILENVRMRSWWPSAGHGAPIGISGHAYLGCRRCEFLGGDLRSGGRAISIRGNSLATFDACVFADIGSTVLGWSGASAKSAVHFENCVFENARLTDGRILYRDKPEFPITVRGGSVAFDPVDEWGARYAANVEGVRFGPRIPRCTVGDLLGVAGAFPLQAGERILGLQLVAATREPPTRFLVWVQDPDGRDATVLGVVGPGGMLDVIRDGSVVSRLPNYRRPEARNYAGRPLAGVLARAARDIEAYGIEEAVVDDRSVVRLRDAEGQPFRTFDGGSGEEIK